MGIVALGPAYESGLFAGSVRGEVLRALCNNADDDRFECYPSYEYIAFTAGCGRSTVARELKALIHLGLLEIVEAGGGRRRSNRYRINVPLIEICRHRVRAAKNAAGRESKARIEAMIAARIECEEILKNRPAGGRFPEENRPAGDGNRPAGDIETVPPRDSNRHKNLQKEKTRARGAADPDGTAPRGGEEPVGESAAGSEGADREARAKGALENQREAQSSRPADRDRFWRQRFILDWLEGKRPDLMVCRALEIDATRLTDAQIEEIALSMRPTYVKTVAGFVRWAEACNAGDASQKPPIPSVRQLMEMLADPRRRPLMQRQMALLAAKDEEHRHHPDTDESGSEQSAA